ncbi:MAG: glycosyltransferase family 9 protein [Bacteroidales bacterium]|nr:glycosyltransferase family 9 protein [Bacteroidales bacterium]
MKRKDLSLNILVIRLSAFGDVAMTLPALYSAAKAYPIHTFYMLTSESFEGLFTSQLPNIEVVGVDLKLYKGVTGLLRLASKIQREYKIDAVADLHSVLRSQVVRSYFFLRGKKVKSIYKDRAKKKAITKYKIPLTQLKHSIDRYRDVFMELGLASEMSFVSYFENKTRNISQLSSLPFDASKTNIGIAPFAMYAEKMYPIDKMEEVLKEIAAKSNRHIYLFGGGKKEKEKLEEWEAKYPNVTSVIGKLTLENELLLMSYLSVLVSMDSANMHLASLVNTSVVSVWGATHPFLGFYGYNQPPSNVVQLEDLDCRPCSVFGNVPCWRGDHACMNRIDPKTAVEKIEVVIEANAQQ